MTEITVRENARKAGKISFQKRTPEQKAKQAELMRAAKKKKKENEVLT
jgi:hypothetical protein